MTENKRKGDYGEEQVCKLIACPRCKKKKFKKLTNSFESVDIICEFCGKLAQVKTTAKNKLPNNIPGSAWKQQKELILANIYHDLYIVLIETTDSGSYSVTSVYHIADHTLQKYPEVYCPRKPLSETAQRAGWQGFNINLKTIPDFLIEEIY